jgi:hypothetical protein
VRAVLQGGAGVSVDRFSRPMLGGLTRVHR